MTDNSSDVESIACGLAAEVLGVEPDTMVNPLTVLASPAWRGVEAAIWRASNADKSIILKQFHDDTGFYVDQSAAILASDQAGKLGVGPKVLKSWPAQNTIGFEDLTALGVLAACMMWSTSLPAPMSSNKKNRVSTGC